MEITHNIDLCLPEGQLEDVAATFDITTEVVDREPHSWGEGRGSRTDHKAALVSVKLGDATIGRDQSDLMFGPDIVGAEATVEILLNDGDLEL